MPEEKEYVTGVFKGKKFWIFLQINDRSPMTIPRDSVNNKDACQTKINM